MYFEPYGPFWPERSAREKGRFWRSEFWNVVENEGCEGLSTARGIYVFSLSFGNKFTPWYIGKACSRGGFSSEVFQGHKLLKYYESESGRRGYPALHLVARVEYNRHNFCRPSARADAEIERVETYLIGMALTVNPSLKNDCKTKFQRELDIAGVIGPKYTGARTEAARTLRGALGL